MHAKYHLKSRGKDKRPSAVKALSKNVSFECNVNAVNVKRYRLGEFASNSNYALLSQQPEHLIKTTKYIVGMAKVCQRGLKESMSLPPPPPFM